MSSPDPAAGGRSVQVGAAKLCIVCGADCAGKLRVKDPNGRYYCHACYEQVAEDLKTPATASAPVRAAAPARGPDPDADVSFDLAGLASLASSASVGAPMQHRSACPDCRRILDPQSAVCVGCGYDVRSGRGGKTHVVRAQASSSSSGWVDYVANPGAWIGWMTKGQRGQGSAGTFAFAVAFLMMLTYALLNTFGPTFSQRNVSFSPTTTAIVAGIVGTICAVIYWLVGPAFYRLRVRMCGGECDSNDAQLAYFATVVPAALVFVPWGLLTYFTSGSSAVATPDLAALVTTIKVIKTLLLGLGCVHLWFMTWKGFNAKPVSSFILIVAVPIGFYVLFIILLSATTAIATKLRDDPSFASRRGTNPWVDQSTPPAGGSNGANDFSSGGPEQRLTHAASTEAPYAFQYPASWHVSIQDEVEGIPFRPVTCQGPSGGEVIIANLGFRESALPLVESLDDAIAGFRMGGLSMVPIATADADIRQLNRWRGRGREFRINERGMTFTFTIFIVEADDSHGRILLATTTPDNSPPMPGGGIDTILSSLTFSK